MFREIFNEANDTIKMDTKMKSRILDAMEHEQVKKSRRKSFGTRKVILAAAVIILMTGTIVNAYNNNWDEGMDGLFTSRIRQYEWDKVSNINFKSSNFMSSDEIEQLGNDTDIKTECGGVEVQVTRLFADYYSLYGIIEITAPEDIKFREDHKSGSGCSFEICPVIFNYPDGKKEPIVMQAYESYVIKDGDEKDNKISFTFCINTATDYTDKALNDNILNGSLSIFSGNIIQSLIISSNCECPECVETCDKINELLHENNFNLQLPENISSMGDGIYIDNIAVTPFSIRYIKNESGDSLNDSLSVVFKNGEIMDIDTDTYAIGDLNEKLFFTEFPKPVHLENIEYLLIDNQRVDIKK